VASLTDFPDSTKDMFEWWFWWHSVESERYAIWHPYCHVSIEAKDKSVFTDTSLSNAEKFLGNTHTITEYLNDQLNEMSISFVKPTEMGFDEEVLKNANIVASACGYVYLQRPKLKICNMLHLFKDTGDGGGQLISRYYLGEDIQLELADKSIKLPNLFKRLLLKNQPYRLKMAYEQLMHDQIEFTNLASFLPSLYQEFVDK